jgi:hypothetical protein
MQLVASGAFDRIHLLNGERRESLRIHRKTCIDELTRGRALDYDPVQLLLASVLGKALSARRVPRSVVFLVASGAEEQNA